MLLVTQVFRFISEKLRCMRYFFAVLKLCTGGGEFPRGTQL
jgi:hypothetical protein